MKKDLFRFIAEKVVKYKFQVTIAWIILIIISLFGASQVDTVLKGEGSYSKKSESYKQNKLIDNDFPQQFTDNLIIVLKSDKYTVEDEPFISLINNIKGKLSNIEDVGATYDYNLDSSLLSKNKKSTFLVVGLEYNPDNVSSSETGVNIAEQVKKISVPKDFKLIITGGPVIVNDMARLSSEDGANSERRIIPLVVILLIFVFGALVSAFIPIIIAFMSIFMTLCILFIVGQFFELTIFCKAITSMMGLGVGIDYSLFMVSRFKEELANDKPKDEAAIETAALAGKAITYSGLAVATCMGVLLIPDLPLTRSIGFSGSIVVICAVILSVTFLPALFAIFGDRINSPRKFNRLVDLTLKTKNIWFKWSKFVMKMPYAFFISGTIILLFFSSFAFGMKLWNSSVLLMPDNLDSRIGFEEMLKIDPSRKFSPVGISFETKDGSSVYNKENISEIYKFAEESLENPKIDRILGLVNPKTGQSVQKYQELYANTLLLEQMGMIQPNPFVSGDKQKTMMWLMHKDHEDPTEDWATVKELRKMRDSFKSNNLNILVGGGGSINVDFRKAVYEYFPLVIILIIISTFVIMFLLTGSFILPIKAIFMNILSVIASYGWLVLVFQYGLNSSFFQIQEVPGAIMITTPLVLFCIIFGLSMDYEIFIMSRIKEEYDNTEDLEYSIAMGLEKSGGIVTSAALIMIIVFEAFAFSNIILVQEMGVGLATAVFFDATIIRIMLVPSILKILGKSAWWVPEFIRKRIKFAEIKH